MKIKAVSIIMMFLTLSFSEVYDGYTLYTPGGGFGGGSATTYLKDSDWNTMNTWNHDCGAASMPYFVLTDEPGLENSLLYYLHIITFNPNFKRIFNNIIKIF